jgi:uncharacterized protein (TIGR03435 family)
MNLARRLAPLTRALCAVVMVSPLIGADQFKFEEASVKRADRCSMQNSMDPGRIALNGDPLKVVLMEAFKVKMDQIVGPSWLDADCFSIVAKMPEGATRDQLPAMLQALLVERFKLATHKETHLRAGYALIVDKNGPKFKESDPTSPAARPRGQVTFGFAPAAGGFKGSTTMAWFAGYLSTRLGVPVQDLTGMMGTYDLDVSWVADPALEKIGPIAEAAGTSPGPADPVAGLPAGAGNIFTSIRNSLGLRLEPRRAQAEVVVIDHIERVPTEN